LVAIALSITMIFGVQQTNDRLMFDVAQRREVTKANIRKQMDTQYRPAFREFRKEKPYYY
jgi:hypothetical protein